MSPAVFIDANVPIYASGRDHPYKQPCSRILRIAAYDPDSFVTDAEVLQELVHLYLSSRRWPLGRDVALAFAEAMRGRIEPVLAEDVTWAMHLADYNPDVSSRDLLHASVMRRLGSTSIISADADFDRLQGIDRLDPARLGEWEQLILTHR